MMKKIYIQPTIDVAEIETRLSLLTGSDTNQLGVYNGTDDAVEEDDQLSSTHYSIWNDDE